jgi:ribosomal protein S18 acetylase RimI-like enzyme
MLFVSPPSAAAMAAEAELVRRLCAAQQPDQVHILQAILDPWQAREAELIEAAGFTALATLVYMQKSTGAHAARTALDLDEGIRVARWSPASRPLFEAAILASYRDTLDCPGLVGLRTIDDILAGHMASGVFTPDLWFALALGDEPVGVLLLSMLPQRHAAELVYLGLSPAWRGRGLGRRLVEHALSLAHARRAETVLLAVDDRNTPAMRLYESLGFVTSARKRALILPVRAARGPGAST